jgi:hypothetical protein
VDRVKFGSEMLPVEMASTAPVWLPEAARFRVQDTTDNDPEYVFPVPETTARSESTARFVFGTMAFSRNEPLEVSNAMRLV